MRDGSAWEIWKGKWKIRKKMIVEQIWLQILFYLVYTYSVVGVEVTSHAELCTSIFLPPLFCDIFVAIIFKVGNL